MRRQVADHSPFNPQFNSYASRRRCLRIQKAVLFFDESGNVPHSAIFYNITVRR